MDAHNVFSVASLLREEQGLASGHAEDSIRRDRAGSLKTRPATNDSDQFVANRRGQSLKIRRGRVASIEQEGAPASPRVALSSPYR